MNRETPERALRIAGWSTIAIAAGHLLGLLWAWSFFRAVRHRARDAPARRPGCRAALRPDADHGRGLPGRSASTRCQEPAICAGCRCCGRRWS